MTGIVELWIGKGKQVYISATLTFHAKNYQSHILRYILSLFENMNRLMHNIPDSDSKSAVQNMISSASHVAWHSIKMCISCGGCFFQGCCHWFCAEMVYLAKISYATRCKSKVFRCFFRQRLTFWSPSTDIFKELEWVQLYRGLNNFLFSLFQYFKEITHLNQVLSILRSLINKKTKNKSKRNGRSSLNLISR